MVGRASPVVRAVEFLPYLSEYGAPAVYAGLPEDIRKLVEAAEAQPGFVERDGNGRDG